MTKKERNDMIAASGGSWQVKMRTDLKDRRDEIMGELEGLARDAKDFDSHLSTKAWQALYMLKIDREKEEEE